ncbi:MULTISPECIES: hypothetical protein [Paenibacillus]|uniref:hypothetical protein n=1 Tax=Paenibacillus TaxID=44249 RepID=UPI000C9FACD0|nr:MULTISPECIES: hypothetical protein [Paenibacillus]KAF6585980.1 hypothetical protein G9G57_04590 [Paenibacillus sp. EKM211P]MDN4085018.1 hypothetical protein [Paenibacillus polymyxa]MDN4108016.1 hypothetical protein [Paenibacillus polymyxa]PNQ84141.1 hypothetical protein C1T20_19450 [Paenibacillus polymyxa]UQQ33994.1 hypothetical protein LMH85_17225 [Paenibacillus polymyxa]
MNHSIQSKLVQLNEILSQNNIDHYYIYDYTSRPKLVLAGSFDFSYYHNIEITFYEVSFLSCPGGVFSIECFRLANDKELEMLKTVSYGFHEGPVICMEDKTFGTRFFIAAESLDYELKTVLYYKRENLQPHESVAEWVEKDGEG